MKGKSGYEISHPCLLMVCLLRPVETFSQKRCLEDLLTLVIAGGYYGTKNKAVELKEERASHAAIGGVTSTEGKGKVPHKHILAYSLVSSDSSRVS